MKISNSKKQLAKIIHENGGWREGNYAIQDKDDKGVWFKARIEGKPSGKAYWPGQKTDPIRHGTLLPNWHQTILSREEYFHLYPAPDADGWIEWNGGDIDIDDMQLVDYKMACTPDGKYRTSLSMNLFWDKVGEPQDIIAYRLHKPEQVEPQYCESVTRSIPEPVTATTLDQLLQDYRNAVDFAAAKQAEADEAAKMRDERWKAAQVRACELGAHISVELVVDAEMRESELVITDWRDLRFGDVIEYVDGRNKNRVGMVGRVDKFDFYNPDTDRPIRMVSDNGQAGWPTKWRFIRRP